MQTNREVISNIRNAMKSVNIDDRLPSAFIYSLLINSAQLFIKRESETRRIYNSPELFKKIECQELIDVDDKKCSSLPIPCKNLKRTKNKIPSSFLSTFGSIMYITDINSTERLFQTTIENYIYISKREFKSRNDYYWMNDGYIWIPNSNIRWIDVYILPLNINEVDKLNGEKCKKFLDSECSIPGWMLEDVTRITMEKLGNITKRIPSDENSNLNEHIKQ